MSARLVNYKNAKKFVPFLWNYKNRTDISPLFENLITAIEKSFQGKDINLVVNMTDDDFAKFIVSLEKVTEEEILVLNTTEKASWNEFMAQIKGEFSR